MAFVSVPDERFMTDILKTWISYFKDDSAFTWLRITTKAPDETEKFTFPSLCIIRIGEEWFSLARTGWYYKSDIKTATTVWTLRWYRVATMYQLSLYAKTHTELLKRTMLINKKLQSSTMADQLATFNMPKQTVIPVLDYASPTVPTQTDLKIRFHYPRDIDWREVPSMDEEVQHYAITVRFWVDYLKEYDSHRILSTAFVPQDDVTLTEVL